MKHIFLIFLGVFLLTLGSANAQFIRLSTYTLDGVVLGDFAKKEIANPSAAYADFTTGGGVEFNYYTQKNIGIGLRWSGTYYARDFETYENDLLEMLNITDELYDVTQSLGIWSFGSDIGISYNADISEQISFEPYFYLGFRMLSSPFNKVIYSQNGTTYHYQQKLQLFLGLAYAPGVKIHWNAGKHIGLYLALEYNGSTYVKDNERSLLYSADTFSTTDTEKKYAANAVNFGLGLSFKFGKGLNE